MSSLVIFTVNVGRLASFYEAVLDARPLVEASGDIRFVGGSGEVFHSLDTQEDCPDNRDQFSAEGPRRLSYQARV
jgi:hypothetical protein